MHHITIRLPIVAGMVMTAGLALGGPATAAAVPDCSPARAERIDAVPYAQQRFAPARLAQLATGRGVTVAVVDSGVDATHRQLAGRVDAGRDYLRGEPDARRDCNGHGTAVAGIIVAGPPGDGPRATVDLQGLAPDARILPVRVSERTDPGDQSGGEPVDAATFARAIVWAADRAQVVNLSLALYEDDPAVAAAVRHARARDVVIVAAAGNRGRDGAGPTPYPAAYDGVLGVGAVDARSVHADFSQRGAYVDVVAPGVGVTVATADGGYRRADGTSFAAPFVAATVALLRERYPSMTAPQIIDRIVATADPAPGGRDSDAYGGGVMNPYRALTESPGTTPAFRPAAVRAQVEDPARQAVRHRRTTARTRALVVAAAGTGAVAVAVLAGLVLPRGSRRRWRPAGRA